MADLSALGIPIRKTDGTETTEPIRHAKEDILASIEDSAKKHGVDSAVLKRLINYESGYNPYVVSPDNAAGLGQAIPSTARALGVQNPFDPKQSIEGAAKYLRENLDTFNNDYELAVAAYQAGPTSVRRSLEKGGRVPKGGDRYTTTEKYAKDILAGTSKATQPAGFSLTDIPIRKIEDVVPIRRAEEPAAPSPTAPSAAQGPKKLAGWTEVNVAPQAVPAESTKAVTAPAVPEESLLAKAKKLYKRVFNDNTTQEMYARGKTLFDSGVDKKALTFSQKLDYDWYLQRKAREEEQAKLPIAEAVGTSFTEGLVPGGSAMETEYSKKLKEKHPIASTVGTVAGMLVPTVGTAKAISSIPKIKNALVGIQKLKNPLVKKALDMALASGINATAGGAVTGLNQIPEVVKGKETVAEALTTESQNVLGTIVGTLVTKGVPVNLSALQPVAQSAANVVFDYLFDKSIDRKYEEGEKINILGIEVPKQYIIDAAMGGAFGVLDIQRTGAAKTAAMKGETSSDAGKQEMLAQLRQQDIAKMEADQAEHFQMKNAAPAGPDKIMPRTAEEAEAGQAARAKAPEPSSKFAETPAEAEARQLEQMKVNYAGKAVDEGMPATAEEAEAGQLARQKAMAASTKETIVEPDKASTTAEAAPVAKGAEPIPQTKGESIGQEKGGQGETMLNQKPAAEGQTPKPVSPQKKPQKPIEPEYAQTRTTYGDVNIDPVMERDYLTQLPNQGLTKSKVAELDEIPAADGGKRWFARIDGDNAKAINDVISHEAFDVILKKIGKAFHQFFPEKTARFMGREGGEEFFIDFGDTFTDADLSQLKALHDHIAQNVKTADGQPFTMSIGVGRGAEMSDKAVYAAKENGRNQIVVDKSVDGEGEIQYHKNTDVDPKAKKYVGEFAKKQIREQTDALLKRGDIDEATAQRIIAEIPDSEGAAPSERSGVRYAEELPKPTQKVTTPPAKPPKKPPVAEPGTPEGGDQSIVNLKPDAKRGNFDSEGLPSESISDVLLRKFSDRFRRMEVAEKTPGVKVSEESSAHQKQKLMGGKIKKTIDDLDMQYVEPMMKDLNASGIPVFRTPENAGKATFEDYLYAKHAAERNAHVANINERFRNVETEGGAVLNDVDRETGSGMSNEEAAKILTQVKASGKEKTYESAAKKLWDLQNKKLDIYESSGRYTPEQVAAMREYKNYVPLKGLWAKFDKEDAARLKQLEKIKHRSTEQSDEVRRLREMRNVVAASERKGSFGVGSGMTPKLDVKTALGRRSKASNLLANSVADVQNAVIFKEKNEVMKSFKKFVEDNPAPDLWSVEAQEQKPVFNRNTGEVEYRTVKAGTEDAIPVYEKGKRYNIHVKDELLRRAMKDLMPETNNVFINAGRKLNRYLAAVITKFSPRFILSNIERDVQAALANIGGEYSAKTAAAFAKNLPGSIGGVFKEARGGTGKWAEAAADFRANGGSTEAFGGEPLDSVKNRLEKTVKLYKKGTLNAGLRVAKNIGKLIEDSNRAIEGGTRLAVYKSLVDAGYSKQHAALAAKNVTVDFGMRGEWGENIGALYLFANANIQGSVRTLKGFVKSNRIKAISAGIAGGAYALTQMNRFNAGENKDDGENYYDKIPDSVKQRYWIFIPPEGMRDALDKAMPFVAENDGIKYIRIALPWGYNVFHAAGVAADKAINTKEPVAATGYVLSAIANAFNPLGGNGPMSLVPTAIRPVVSLMRNEDELGRPIRKEQPYGVAKAKSELAFESNSEWAKALAHGINKLTGGTPYQEGALKNYTPSPGDLDYIFNAATGGVGRFLSDLVSLGISGAKKEKPNLAQVPLVGWVVGQTTPSIDERKFYDNTKRLDKLAKDFEIAEDPNAFERKHDAELQIQKEFSKKYLRRVKDINKKIKEIEAVKNPTEGDKRAITAYEKQKIAIMREFNGILNREGK